MQNALNNTLIDVRKAYRLLFEYQDRIKNLVSFIGGHFDFEFKEGHSIFSNHAKSGAKVDLDHWAWDWLSMYFYHFKFAPKDDLTFSVFILTDTGYYDVSKKDDTNVSKIKPETFNTVEKAKTKLFLVLGKKMWWQDTKLGHWENILFQDNNIFSSDEGGKLVFKEYTLDQFVDEGSAISSLKDFHAFYTQNDIVLQLKQRDLQ